ncbi:MAG: phospholipid carrier-dependent glycosyltransferase [Asticcacaulis sp.]
MFASKKLQSFAKTLWNADDKTLRWVLGALVVVLACFNFVRDIDNPPHAFWDESYYVTAAERYQEHRAQYASHPPLAFMMMSLGIDATGSNKTLDTHSLGEVKKVDATHTPKDGYDFTGIRLPAALFAVVGALLFYLIVLRLSGEAFEAFVFSLLFLFENAYIVHFRAAHLDSYQLTFTLGSILVWLSTYGREPKRPLVTYALFGLLCGLSFMCKVNSLVILALAGLSLLRSIWLERTRANLMRVIARGVSVGAAFTVAVATIFTLHVVLNPVAPDPNTDSGRRDLKYMSQDYKDWLNHKGPLTPGVVWDATTGYYTYMKHDFVGEIKTEANGSQPVLWPFMVKAISYRWDSVGDRTAYTQMIGNPVNWGLAILGIAGAAVLIVQRRSFKAGDADSEDLDRLEAIFAMYMIFWVFHIWLGTQRVMYIYHYFIGLALSFMLVPLVFKIAARKIRFIDTHRFVILCGLSLLIAASYLWYAPLTYHQFITRGECEARNWPVVRVICQPNHKPKPASATRL